MKKSNWTPMNGKAAGLAIVLMLAGVSTAQASDKDNVRRVDLTSCAKPEYPQADLQAKHEGTVKMGFLADAQGAIVDSKVTKSSGFPSLDEAARSAIAKCRFSPATSDAQAKQWTQVTYVWTLK